MQRLTPSEIQQLQQTAHPPLIVDVRTADEYQEEHVAGAVNIHVSQLAARTTELPANRPLITYCFMMQRGASRGERAAEILEQLGFEVAVLEGGIPAWKEAGAPTEKSSR